MYASAPVRLQYPTEHSEMDRYELDISIRHFGKFDTTSIPVPYSIVQYFTYQVCTFFGACCSPAGEVFSRTLGCGFIKEAVSTLRRTSGSQPSSAAVL